MSSIRELIQTLNSVVDAAKKPAPQLRKDIEILQSSRRMIQSNFDNTDDARQVVALLSQAMSEVENAKQIIEQIPPSINEYIGFLRQ